MKKFLKQFNKYIPECAGFHEKEDEE